MSAFEVFSWSPLPFIVPVVSLLRFTVMGRTLKAVTGFAVVSATACSCSPELMKPASPALKNKLPKWHSAVPVSGIPQGRSKQALTQFKKLASKRITSSPVAHADVALTCEPEEQ